MPSVSTHGPALGAARPPPTFRPPVGIGSVIAGRYELQSLLGKGGMGTVYSAWQRDLERQVAIKVLPRPPAFRADGRQQELERRFEREARCAARITHPHAVQIFEVGRSRRACFLAMELVDGVSLFRCLQRGRLELGQALDIARQVGSAVAAAHAQGTLHRDLKPGNIMLLRGTVGDGGAPFAKLLDFGLAKEFGLPGEAGTQAGRRLGSPGYMAPEQVQGGAVDARADVYGLAAVLFEMLAGRPPFAGSDARELMRAHIERPVPSLQAAWSERPCRADVAALQPGMREALDAILQRGLAKRPEHRFATMGSFVAALAHGQISPGAADEATRLASFPLQAAPWELPPRSVGGPRWPSGARSPSPPPVPWTPAADRSGEVTSTGANRGRRGWLVGLLGAAIGVAGSQAVRHVPEWQIESLPRDAAVYWNDRKICEQTPCRVRWQRDEVGGQGMLRLVREGFDDVLLCRRIGHFSQQLRVTLDAADFSGPETGPAPPR